MASREETVKKLEDLFFSGESPPPPTLNKSGEKTKLVVFIHGWSGSEDSKTWGSFFDLFRKDHSLRNKYNDVTYTYYSPKINWRFLRWLKGQKLPKIDDLANGLKTTIDQEYKEYDSITLFCHSLGGLVAMRYLVSLNKQGIDHKVDKLVMYATPLNGSDFAGIGQYVSSQIEQMCNESDFLTALNEDYLSLKIFEDVKTHYYIGDQDAVVNVNNAPLIFSQENIKFGVIPNCDHQSVVKPKAREDLQYDILRCILLDK